ncbi:MAG: tetratricopeptide (TPR) repeat protein [Patescibacteria group bacterium]|jgi:tetratricopeptide (TPR) repeat protein
MQLIKEKTIPEMQAKLDAMQTELNKLSYLEIALKEHGFSFEIKRYLLEQAGEFYAYRKMYEKAAKTYTVKASLDITQKDRLDSYISAAEFHAKSGKVESADDIFIKATRETDELGQKKIQLARKNIFLLSAQELERNNKKASAVKFYEKLIKMPIEKIEKDMIKEKLITTYKALGMFREAKLIQGI